MLLHFFFCFGKVFTSREAAWSCRTVGRKKRIIKRDLWVFGQFLLLFCLLWTGNWYILVIIASNLTCKFYLKILLANFACKFYLQVLLVTFLNWSFWKINTLARFIWKTCKFYVKDLQVLLAIFTCNFYLWSFLKVLHSN